MADEKFIGRCAELAQLRTAFETAIDGKGRMVVVYGAAGIGKTRTTEEFLSWAISREALALTGRCFQTETDAAFAPWDQVIRAYYRAERPDGWSSFEAANPELAAILKTTACGAVIADSNQIDRHRIFRGFAEWIADVSSRHPLVIFIDDVHWLKDSALQLLASVFDEVRDRRVLLVVACRNVEVDESHPLRPVLHAARRERRLTRIHLQGLSAAHVKDLIEVTGEGVAPLSLVNLIHTETEGNPFFVEEVWRSLVESELIQLKDGAWISSQPIEHLKIPESVRFTIHERIMRLPENCRRTLNIASVLGRTFEAHALLRICHAEKLQNETNAGRSDSSRVAVLLRPEEDMLAALDEAVNRRVIEKVPGTLSCYRFSHSLIHESLYDDLSGLERRRLHAVTGRALEHLYGINAAAHAGELARHFIEAASILPDDDRTLKYARLAADKAASSLAFEEAARRYDQIRELLSIRGANASEEHAEVLLALGQARLRAGDFVKGEEAFMRAADLARLVGYNDVLARAGLGIAGAQIPVSTKPNPALISLLEDALSVIPADDARRAELTGRLAWALHYDDRATERRRQLAREAISMARQADNPHVLAAVLNSAHWALWEPDNVEERLAMAQEMIELSENTRDVELQLQGWGWCASDWLEKGNIGRMHEAVERYARLAGETRQPWHQWYLSRFRSMCALLDGDFAMAEQLALEGHRFGRVLNADAADLVLAGQIAGALVLQERWDELVALLAERERASPAGMMPLFACALADALAHTNRSEQARAILDRFVGMEFASIPFDNTWMASMCALAETAAILGDTTTCQQISRRLEPHADRPVVLANAVGFFGNTSYYLGLMARVLGNGTGTEDVSGTYSLNRRRIGGTSTGSGAEVARPPQIDDGNRSDLVELPDARLHDPPSFLRTGDYWTIRFQGHPVLLNDIRGFQYLAQLLRSPGRQIHVSEIIDLAPGTRVELSMSELGTAEMKGKTVSEAMLPSLDVTAQRQYRRRLEELREDLVHAQHLNDSGRTDHIQQEMDALLDELSTVVRRSRGSIASERARLTVTKGIRAALDRIDKADRKLGEHLISTIRTGYFCSYTPDPRIPMIWLVRTDSLEQVS